MSKSLVCFEIDNENLGALSPIFVYAENLHIEPVKVVTVDPGYETLVDIATKTGTPGSKRKVGELTQAQIEKNRLPRPGTKPWSERSTLNPDARNYKNSKVQQVILKRLLPNRGMQASYITLQLALEEAGLRSRSLSPALSWLVREKLVERDGKDRVAWLTPMGKEKAETL